MYICWNLNFAKNQVTPFYQPAHDIFIGFPVAKNVNSASEGVKSEKKNELQIFLYFQLVCCICSSSELIFKPNSLHNTNCSQELVPCV